VIRKPSVLGAKHENDNRIAADTPKSSLERARFFQLGGILAEAGSDLDQRYLPEETVNLSAYTIRRDLSTGTQLVI
jgi:hypothetical protein